MTFLIFSQISFQTTTKTSHFSLNLFSTRITCFGAQALVTCCCINSFQLHRIKSHKTIITITCLMIPMLNNVQKQILLCVLSFAVANRKIYALRNWLTTPTNNLQTWFFFSFPVKLQRTVALPKWDCFLYWTNDLFGKTTILTFTIQDVHMF